MKNRPHLITFNSFGNKEAPTMLSVINHGFIKNNKIEYLTKDGKQHSDISNIKMCKVVTENEIDFKSSLYFWLIKNPGHYSKSIKIDNELKTGETYSGNSWRYGLLIMPEETEIKVKIIFE